MYVLFFLHFRLIYFFTVIISVCICSIVTNAIVVVVTIRYTYGMVKTSRQVNIPAVFSSMLLRAGKIIVPHRDMLLTLVNSR